MLEAVTFKESHVVAAGRLPSGAYAGSVKHAGFTSRLGWIVFFSVGSNDF